MTDRQPRRLCCTCFQQWAPLGAYKCLDCSLGRAVPNATATKRQTAKLDLSQGLPETLAGYSLDDFIDTSAEIP